MNTKEKSKSEIPERDTSYYQHLEDARIKKEQYWNDYNQHRDEINETLNTQSPGEETIQNEQNEERESKSMPFTQVLHYPYTKMDDYKGNGPICISWYVYGRQAPVATINQLIDARLGLMQDEDISKQLRAINEYFTESEQDQLQDYLSRHPIFSTAEFESQKITLPVNKIQAPLTDVPRADYRYLFPIFKNADYDLDFLVVGLYIGKYNHRIPKEYYKNTTIWKLYHDPIPATR